MTELIVVVKRQGHLIARRTLLADLTDECEAELDYVNTLLDNDIKTLSESEYRHGLETFKSKLPSNTNVGV